MKPRFFIFLLSLALINLFSCTGKASKADPECITMGLEASVEDLDPRTATDANSSRICSLIYSSLFTKGRDSNLIPDIVESYEIENDLVFIFHIKRGILFHDKRELTSRDIKYTFCSMLDEDFVSFKKASYEIIKEIMIIDDYTLAFELKEVFSPFLDYLTIGIIPENIDRTDSSFLRKNPVGSGPFRLVNHREGISLSLERFDEYFGKKPKIKNIIFRIIPDTTTRMLELENKGIDLLQNDIPYDSVDRFSRDKDYTLSSSQGINYQYIGFNLQDSILKNNNIRKALAFSIDRDTIIKHIYRGFALKADSILSPMNWAHCDGLVSYGYDPEKAGELIEKEGYRKDEKGIYFTLEYKTSENAQALLLAQIIQDQLRNTGIGIKIVSREWGTFYSDIKKGDFQLFSLRWVGISDPDIFYYVLSSSSIPPEGANRGRYTNQSVDRLIDLARKTSDRDKRRDYYCRIQHILNEELPYIHLWYHSNLILCSRRIENAVPYPDGSFNFLLDVELAGP